MSPLPRPCEQVDGSVSDTQDNKKTVLITKLDPMYKDRMKLKILLESRYGEVEASYLHASQR